jgi:hypothetical protein
MTLPLRERALLPLIALQGAVATLGGFIGYFTMAEHDVHAMFRFTATMLTTAMASTLLAYVAGPRLRLSSVRLMRLGFLLPGMLLLCAPQSPLALAMAFGIYLGSTWGARHWLEMSLFANSERDRYAARAGTVSVVLSVLTTLAVTGMLAVLTERSDYVYRLYGVLCVTGALLLGRQLPHEPFAPLRDPVAIVRQPQFLACLPLFFLESGLFGISQAMASAGASEALGSASRFGWVATLAGMAGCIALYLTRRKRGVDNRAAWLGGSCLVMGSAFLMLGASVWIPALYIVYSILKAAGSPFLIASEQVLNQRTLDIEGSLSDRILAREVTLWVLRMTSLGLFWMLAGSLTPKQIVVSGSLILAFATLLEYVIGRAWFVDADNAQAA